MRKARPSHAARQVRNALFAWVVAGAIFTFAEVNRSWTEHIDGLESMLDVAMWVAVGLGVAALIAALASLAVGQDRKADAKSRRAMAKDIARR